MPEQKIIKTDPKVLKFLADRGFKPMDEGYRHQSPDTRVYRISCWLGEDDTVCGELIYFYGDPMPQSVRIWPDGKFARRIRLVGKYKWLVYFDDAVEACRTIARINKKVPSAARLGIQHRAMELLNNPKY